MKNIVVENTSMSWRKFTRYMNVEGAFVEINNCFIFSCPKNTLAKIYSTTWRCHRSSIDGNIFAPKEEHAIT